MERFDRSSYRPPKKDDELSNPSRRRFLGGLAAGALITAGFLKHRSFVESPVDTKIISSSQESGPETLPQAEVTASPEQTILQQADDDVVAETLSEQLEHSDSVTIDQKTIEAIYQKWYKEYSPGGARHEDMLQGLERMRPWYAHMRTAFRENNLPEAFMYLTIAESHFQLRARSRSGAEGPYQFMEKTARKHPASLTIAPTYDERIDPIHSARACAKLLADNYRHFGGDIRNPVRYDKTDDALYLAVSGYNGTYPWQYAKITPKKSRSTDDYLAFVERQINTVLKTAVDRSASRKHTVRPKETLAAIAKRYATTTATIQHANQLTGSLKTGQKLRIPVSEQERKALIRRALRNHNENINYPAKFYAIFDVIQSLGLEQKLPAGEKLEFTEIPIQQSERVTLVHTVRKGDTLYSVARQYAKHAGVTEAALRQALITENQLGTSGALAVGQKLIISSSRQAPTLEKLAQSHSVRLQTLQALNPAILSAQHPLASGRVRFPKNTLLAGRT